jgi:4a-hydroxytetrahydrobiopterin dehydratase
MEKIDKVYFIENKWKIENENKLAYKLFKFKDFKAAFSWMNSIAIIAEKNDHHPEWKNVYNKVEVILTTHEIGSLSKKDLDLARAMDESFEKFL